MLWSAIPIELTLRIFTFFDPAELVDFRRVNSFFKSLIDETITLQYRIALFASGMENGPSGVLTTSERLESLRNYEASWKKLEWTEHHTISYPQGLAWALYGNVWAHSRGSDAIDFVQLPSRLRGIPIRQWTLRFDFDVGEFSMDPSQDLLVIIENTSRNLPNLRRIRLRTLSTGEKHPLAESTAALEHTLAPVPGPGRDPALYSIRICGDYVGILVRNPAYCRNELVVWSWKTGAQNLMVLSTGLISFVFLDNNFILGSSCQRGEPPALLVYRLEQRPAGRDDTVTTPTNTHFLRFLLGRRFQSPRKISYILLASYPSPGWLPSAGQVPFHIAGDERMLAMYSQYVDDLTTNGSRKTFLIPTKAFLRQIERLSHEEGRDVEWEVHSPQPIEHLPEHVEWDESWPYFAFGMRQVFIRMIDDNIDNMNILIRDLSPRRCLRANEEEREKSDALYKSISRGRAGGSHGMPYPRSILRCAPYPRDLGSSWDMKFLISEDGIVLLENDKGAEGPAVLHLLTL